MLRHWPRRLDLNPHRHLPRAVGGQRGAQRIVGRGVSRGAARCPRATLAHALAALVTLLACWGSAATAAADDFSRWEVRPELEFQLPATPSVNHRGPVLFDNLADGRLVMISTLLPDPLGFTGIAEMYVETAVRSRTWDLLGTLPLPGGDSWSSFGGAFLRVSPDGSRIAVGDNSFVTPRVGVFSTADLLAVGPATMAVDWYPVPHSSAAWYDNQYLAINRGDFSASNVALLDTNSPVATPGVTTVVNNIGGASGAVAFDADGNLYTANGFDTQPGGSQTGTIKKFALADWQNAANTLIPLNFEATGQTIATILSASSLEFDTEGNLFIGGSDFFGGGQSDFLALLQNPELGGGLRIFDPDTSAESSYNLVYNEVTRELYANQSFPLVDPIDPTIVYVLTVPEPASWTLVLSGLVAVAVYRRRRRGSCEE